MSFRPRLGMGWFDYQILTRLGLSAIFVPKWGWVGSLPSHFIGWNNWVFVPEWGWVGSCQKVTIWSIEESFRPHLGMGWFTGFNPERFQKIAFFVPAWGWVGSILVTAQVTDSKAVFVPAWGWVGSS